MLEQGPVEKKIIEQCLRAGQPIPARIQNAPELLFGLEFYYQAFQQLSLERPVGFGAAPIPMRAVLEYSSWLGLERSETEDLLYHVRELDNTFIKYHTKENKDGKPS